VIENLKEDPIKRDRKEKIFSYDCLALTPKDGDRIRVDLKMGEIFDLTQKKKFFATPSPPSCRNCSETAA